jgi:hypothetical protein
MLSRETKNYYRHLEKMKQKQKALEEFKARRDAHREAYKYNPLELICASHGVKFVRYLASTHNDTFLYSHGCPVCVGLIRAKVKLELARCYQIGVDGIRKLKFMSRDRYGKTKCGRPETKTVEDTPGARAEI